MYAVIKNGGRQFKVAVGETLEVDRLSVADGDQVRFEEVLLISDSNNVMVGNPLLSNALVLATAVRQTRGPKLIVFKYKSKKRYRHKRGHRQDLTFLTIDDIVADGKSLLTGEEPKFREPGAPVDELDTDLADDTAAADETAAEAETTETQETAAEGEQKTSRRRRVARTADEDTTENAEE